MTADGASSTASAYSSSAGSVPLKVVVLGGSRFDKHPQLDNNSRYLVVYPSLSSVATHLLAAQAAAASRPTQPKMLTPPYHFGIVSAPLGPNSTSNHILYRGSFPAARNASFLRRLGIKTLVCLRKKPLKDDEPLAVWAAKRGIDVQWVKAEKMTEERLGMERQEVSDVLKVSYFDDSESATLAHACTLLDPAQPIGLPDLHCRRRWDLAHDPRRRGSSQASRLAPGLHRERDI